MLRRKASELKPKDLPGYVKLNYPEDYEIHWGGIDYEGKVVLDLGADDGNTAEFFYNEGAEKVIAVEGSEPVFNNLMAWAKTKEYVLPCDMWIDSPAKIEYLLKLFKPDIVKVDIEGAETNFEGVRYNILRLVPIYIIECHSLEIFSRIGTYFGAMRYAFESVSNDFNFVVKFTRID